MTYRFPAGYVTRQANDADSIASRAKGFPMRAGRRGGRGIFFLLNAMLNDTGADALYCHLNNAHCHGRAPGTR